MQVDTLDVTIREHIKEIENGYEQRIKELQHTYERQTQAFEQIQIEYQILKERYDLLIYKRFARSAEQLLEDKKQPLLFTTEEVKNEAPSKHEREAFSEVKSFTRKKGGRKAIDPNIPREERSIDIAEEDKICACGEKLLKIGEETSEKLYIEPPRIYVVKTIRPKYACRSCEGTGDEDKPTVRIAAVEPSIIPRGIASASLLSTIMTQKFEDHLPYFRQETQFQRIGVTISRQDMSNWQQQVYNKVQPIFDVLTETVRSGPVIQMDETTVQVIGEEGRDDTLKSHMWLARGGPPGRPVILYTYHPTRKASHAKELLSGYSGYLQTDGYRGYDCALKDNTGILHVGCFAHARRKFFEAAKVSAQAETAKEGIQYIKRLYVIEDELRKKHAEKEEDDEIVTAEKLEAFRTERFTLAKPVLDEFKAWLDTVVDKVPPSMLLGQAIAYALGQWDKLRRYLESPYLTPDNNACENAIRPFVVGRKNWIFCQSPDGAESSCGMYSLIQTAKHNGVNTFHYLKALFEKAPFASSPGDWQKLLPWNIFKS